MKHGKIFGMGNEWMCFIREGDFSSYYDETDLDIDV